MSLIGFLARSHNALWHRLTCWTLASSLALTTGGLELIAMGVEEGQKAAQKLHRPAHYSEKPGPVYKGNNPGRDPVTRGGMWTPKLMGDLQRARELQRQRESMAPEEFMACVTPVFAAFEAFQDPPPQPTSGGGGGPGEGEGPGGSTTSGSTGGEVGGGGPSELNTNTGNRHVAYPIVGWNARGDNGVSFTLHHNSQGAYSFDLGKGWSHSYDVSITHNPLSSAIIRYGDGLEVPYTDSSGTFTPPAGYYDDLVHNLDGTWTLTTKGQWVYEFDDDGRLIEVIDRSGNTTTISRNISGKPTSISDGAGRLLEFTYNGVGLIETVTDPLERVWEFTYDMSNNMTEIIYPELDSAFYDRTFTYNGDHNIISETDRRGKTWTYTYTTGEKLASFTNPLNKTWTWTYTSTAATLTDPNSETIVHNYSSGLIASAVDKSGFSSAYVYDGDKNATQVTDKRGKVWNYTYDGNGNLLTATDPLSRVSTYTYNGANDLLTAENDLGEETEFTYDGDGNLLEVEDALGRTVVSNTYNSYGELIATEDALGRETEVGYDSYGNTISVEAPSGVTTTSDYNLLGWVTEVTDGANSTYEVTYDEWGRTVEVEEPGAAISTIEYDAEGNVTSAEDAIGRTGARVYDDLSRLTSATNAKSETESYVYDDVSRLTSVTNARSYTRTYTYTDRGEVASLTLPDGAVEAWTYNGNGDTTVYTNPLSDAINYTFNDAGEQTGVDYPSGTDSSFTYDDAGRVASMTDATGTTTWDYNAAGEVEELDTPQGTIEYTYNLAGQRATMVEPAGTTTYTYDAAGRLDEIEDFNTDVTSYTYDAAGRISRRDLPNGTYETFAYDARSRVTDILTKNSSNATLASRGYVYDAVSQVTQVVEGGVTTDYDYDLVGQLIEEDKSTGYLANYTYDANGNRLTRTINSVTETYSYDNGDKLTAITGGSDPRTYAYDAAGRTTSITRSGVATTFTYDFESRVTSIARTGLTTNTFTYNALDTRVGKVDSGGTATYLRDGVGVTSPVLSDGSAKYTPSGEDRSGVKTTFHSGLKNTDAQTNASQTVSAARLYDAFGNVLSASGSWKSPFGNAGGFGYQEDNDYEFKLLGHRYYDSSTGRFLTRDPIKDGRNWYVYCGNDPVRRADPTGEVAPLLVLAVVCIAVALSSGVAEAPTVGYEPATVEERANAKIAAAEALTQWTDYTGLGGLAKGVAKKVLIDGGEAIAKAGRRGGLKHRRMVKDTEEALEQKQGWKHIAGGSKPEQRVYNEDGTYRYPDLVFQKPDGGMWYGQIGKVDKHGNPVWREWDAGNDLAGKGEVEFIPYNLRY